MIESKWEPRKRCLTCYRPLSVCWCAHLPSIPTRTDLLILQHPREKSKAIGTAKMASLCLPQSTLVVGTELDDEPRVRAAMAREDRAPILLWPGPGALDLASATPVGPSTLIVVDGTWSLANKLVRINPRLASLPRYALAPPRLSEYRIRVEPRDECVSTLEALMFALGILEGDPSRFQAMMEPFRAMVDTQIAYRNRFQGIIRPQPKADQPYHRCSPG